VAVAANVPGMEQTALVAELNTGKTIADVAKAKGVALGKIVTAFVQLHVDWLNVLSFLRIRCSLCERLCPVKLPMASVDTSSSNCIGCLECVAACPRHAGSGETTSIKTPCAQFDDGEYLISCDRGKFVQTSNLHLMVLVIG
jgi:ferredoxin